MLNRIRITSVVLVTVLWSASSLADTQQYREHLLNARAQLNQALLAFERAERAHAGSTRHRFNTVEAKKLIHIAIDGVDGYLQQPLQPELAKGQYLDKEESR